MSGDLPESTKWSGLRLINSNESSTGDVLGYGALAEPHKGICSWGLRPSLTKMAL